VIGPAVDYIYGVLARLTAIVLATAALATACGGGSSPATGAIGGGLRGPTDLHATVFARGLTHVSALTLDADGRLWATVSGSATHTADGVYLVAHAGARPTKVVSGLVAPLGLVWVGRQLVVSSLGRVTTFSGFDGSHFREARVILRGPVAEGENNNIVLAPNGRLVMGVSASCDSCVPASKWSAAIVSFRPDGSDPKLVARNVRAAYGLAYLPGTSTLFATMNQRDDLGASTPGDWLAVVRPGQDWGVPELLRPAHRSLRFPAEAGSRARRARRGGRRGVHLTLSARGRVADRRAEAGRALEGEHRHCDHLRNRLSASAGRARGGQRRARRRLGHRHRLPLTS